MIYADTCPLPLHIIEREIILILKEKLFLCSDQLPVIKTIAILFRQLVVAQNQNLINDIVCVAIHFEKKMLQLIKKTCLNLNLPTEHCLEEN